MNWLPKEPGVNGLLNGYALGRSRRNRGTPVATDDDRYTERIHAGMLSTANT